MAYTRMQLFPCLLVLLGLPCSSCFTFLRKIEPGRHIYILPMGENFTQDCPFSTVNLTDKLVQFVKLRTEVRMFSSKYSTVTPNLISNNTDLDTGLANSTDRYSVTLVGGKYRLTIIDVKDVDSGEFGCQIYDPATQTTETSIVLKELVVPGPLRGVYWTVDFNAQDQDEEPVPLDNGANVTIDRKGYAVPLACVVLTSNIEPKVTITSGGPLGSTGATNITADFGDRSSGRFSFYDGGLYKFESTVRFVPHTLKGFHTLYCRAEQGSVVLEKSINVQVTYKPLGGTCDPYAYQATPGDTQVQISCVVKGFPPPTVKWILPNSQGNLSAMSVPQQPNYTVTDVVEGDIVISTLTITKIDEDQLDFGLYHLLAVNREGEAIYTLRFTKAENKGVSTEASMTATVLCLILITVANKLFKEL